MRTVAYIDGFNLYYAIRNTPYRWLNLKLLVEKTLARSFSVATVKYYTARVSGSEDPDAPRRQQVYLNALRSIPEIQIHFGNFLAKNMWRPLLNAPLADREIKGSATVTFAEGQHTASATTARPICSEESFPVGKYPFRSSAGRRAGLESPAAGCIKVMVHAMEEKGSDVNLAVHLVNDAWKGEFEAAAVLSNDTDLVEPIRIVTEELKKPVVLLCASRWGAADKLEQVATSVRHINKHILKGAQFPDVVNPGGIPKPSTWTDGRRR